MSQKFEDLTPDEQTDVKRMIDKDMPSLDVRRKALQSALAADLHAASRAAVIRSALNGATEWLRFIDNENGRELSDLEMRGIRSKLIECEAALKKS